MSPLEIFLWGLSGGVGAELTVVFSMRHRAPQDFPYWLKSWAYYVVSIAMVLFGGVITLAYASSGTTLNAILAMQIGASAPLILRQLSQTVPDAPKLHNPSKIN